MGATDDVKYQLSLMNKGENETYENFAKRLYSMQMEVYAANAGADLGVPFDMLEANVQKGWIESAKERSKG